jgi:hypothetical protein
MVVTTMALVVGKAVPVANELPFLRRFDTAAMIRPISGFPEYLATHFTWHRSAAIPIWIFVLFLIYTFLTEPDVRLGEGARGKLLFSRRWSGPELPRQ